MRIAVTGADGFIGRRVCSVAVSDGHTIVPIGLGGPRITDSDGLQRALRDADAVIHLAARVHQADRGPESLREYRRVNVGGTECIANAAVRAGVRRFVFVSSIGVFGHSNDRHPLFESSAPSPEDSYAMSKLEAEAMLRSIERRDGMQIAIVRPPLVYGPFVKGNFLRLLRLLAGRWPLPLGLIENRRSFIGVANLADLLLVCASEPRAAGGLYLASDGEDVSTPELIRLMAAAAKKRNPLFNCPIFLVRWLTKALRIDDEFHRLACSLTVDSSYARSHLGWRPKVSLSAGIDEMVTWYFTSGAP